MSSNDFLETIREIIIHNYNFFMMNTRGAQALYATGHCLILLIVAQRKMRSTHSLGFHYMEPLFYL